MGRKTVSRDSFCVRRLKLLADTTRMAVMEILMGGPRHVWELHEALDLDQSLLSHHLRVLREEGLVEATRDGKAMLYRIASGVEGSRSGKGINLGCCLLLFDEKVKKGRRR